MSDDHLGTARYRDGADVDQREEKTELIVYLNLDGAPRGIRCREASCGGTTRRRWRSLGDADCSGWPGRVRRDLAGVDAHRHTTRYVPLNVSERGGSCAAPVSRASRSVDGGPARGVTRRVRYKMVGVERATEIHDSQYQRHEEHEDKCVLDEGCSGLLHGARNCPTGRDTAAEMAHRFEAPPHCHRRMVAVRDIVIEGGIPG
jgi:hypothetical protein